MRFEIDIEFDGPVNDSTDIARVSQHIINGLHRQHMNVGLAPDHTQTASVTLYIKGIQLQYFSGLTS